MGEIPASAGIEARDILSNSHWNRKNKELQAYA
jgi:hypothetical protein